MLCDAYLRMVFVLAGVAMAMGQAASEMRDGYPDEVKRDRELAAYERRMAAELPGDANRMARLHKKYEYMEYQQERDTYKGSRSAGYVKELHAVAEKRLREEIEAEERKKQQWKEQWKQNPKRN
ncbi:hypothetical protein PAPHI01_1090 [Pancytospora philotis]|nr:hypothetical protein PAPHI01_1090 [Pancytospora philotis]